MATQPVRRQFSVTIKDFYTSYRNEKKKTLSIKDIHPYSLYRKVIEMFLIYVSKKIIKDNFTFMMPYSLGSLLVKSYKVSTKNARIDFNLTRKYKKVVKHLNTHTFQYAFGVKWDKSYTNFKNNSFYVFSNIYSDKATENGVGKRALGKHIKELSKDHSKKSYIRL